MILDASPIVAIALDEAEAHRFALALDLDPTRMMSLVNWFEVLMVVEARRGRVGAERAELLLNRLEVKPLAFDWEQMLEAQAAWRRWGKGRHPAGLNFGDCCAYAAARVTGEPLLFKGGDFAQTDVVPAPW